MGAHDAVERENATQTASAAVRYGKKPAVGGGTSDAKEIQEEAKGDSFHASSDDAKPRLLPVTSKHWRKIRSAVTALAAFRSRRVRAADFDRIKMCGEGGSGLVYLVRLKNTSLFFALKVQRKKDLEAKEQRIRRALIEREVLVACAHPFVCNLYTAFQDSRHLYMLMDFCAGGDLTTLIREVVKRPLTEEEARFYVSEIVAALEWIHLHGYVYRDLKPENVLVHEVYRTAVVRFCNLPGERLNMEEVDKELLKNGSESLCGSSLAAPRSSKAQANGAGGGASARRRSEEDETRSEESAGDQVVSKALKQHEIVVQLDPLLQEASKPGADASVGGEDAVGTGVAPTASAIYGTGCEPEGLTTTKNKKNTRSARAGCCGSHRNRGRSDMDENCPLQTSGIGGGAQPFSRGRGSVKLNVLLDSQTFIGTADFMAPEMVTGKERQGTAMDWWALGVMLFEMTLGTLPFHSELVQSSNEVFRSIVNLEPTFPRRHNLSRAAVNLIQELLRKDPAVRLGERKGVGEIKRHPFFANTHWALLAHTDPPFRVFGPEAPGWLATVSGAPGKSRRNKMATWTWNATNDDARPSEKAAAQEARDLLERDSMSDLLESPGVPVGIGTVELAPKNPGRDNGSANGASAHGQGSSGGVQSESQGAGVSAISAGSSAASKADHSIMGDDATGLKSTASLSSTKLTAQAMAPVAAAPTSADQTTKNTSASHSASKPSFDGYDFNTLRKVGSYAIGGGGSSHGMPKLSSATRSLDAGGNKG